MNLEKIVVIDLIEVTEMGHIQVRQATKIMEDLKEVARTYHRHVLTPGENLEKQDPRVIAIAKAVWTDKVLQNYKAVIEENRK